jgi:superfamily II DNA or RNA helicase
MNQLQQQQKTEDTGSHMNLRPYQVRVLEGVEAKTREGLKRIVIVAPTGCHRKGQRIVMLDGTTRRVEDVRVGDLVLGPDGRSRRVLRLLRGRDVMFRVTPSRGRPFVINGEHVLTLVHRRTGRWIDVRLRDWLRWSKTRRRLHALIRLPYLAGRQRRPAREPVRIGFSVQELSVEPFYGFTLDGDGRYLLDDFTVTHNSGKTVMAAAMVAQARQRGLRALFLAHRKELIDQSADKLSRFGIEAGVIMGNDPRRNDSLAVQVASIPTLSRRKHRPPADLIICDEVHHAASASWRKLIESYSDSTIVGLTATPWRSDGVSLADIFQDHILAATPAELMKLGALVEYDAFAYDAPDLHGVRTVAGDFNQEDLELACNTDVLVGSIVTEYLQHARGRRGLIFPVSVAHSQHLVQEFCAAGVVAEHLDCNTPRAERERILAGLASGEITLVSSVGVLTEGFDCAAVEVCIVARPTKSLSLHLQILGRVLRPSPETGKLRALIHDHAGNLMRHGFPDDDRDYSLTAKAKLVRAPITCPKCFAVFATLRKGCCPACGAQLSSPEEAEEELPARGALETTVVEGRRLTQDEIRALRQRHSKLPYEVVLTDDQLVRAASASVEEKVAEYKRLLEVCARQNYNKGWAYHRFRETFTDDPRFPPELLQRVPAARQPFFPLQRSLR